MKLTTNFGLKKPEGSDVVNIDDFNYNADILDNTLNEVKIDTSSISDEEIEQLFKYNDGDATNPLDYYTKSEIDLKVRVIETTINTNKTNITNNTTLANQALTKANEAFQRGDNVKTQLVDKLISEGLNVSTDNTFEELIGNIALGKKYASGSVVSPSGSTTLNLQLGFSPRLVFIRYENKDGEKMDYSRFTIFFKDIDEARSCGVVPGSSHNYKNVTLREDGIDIYAYGYDKPNTFYWYAFE